jgi:MFS family permease
VSLGVAARLLARFGARAVVLAGLAPIIAGLALLAGLPEDGAYAADVLPSLLLMGVGAGLVLPAVTTLAMGAADPADAGLASGLVNTTQQVGAALGTAILLPIADHGTAFAVAAGIAAGAAVLAVTVLRKEHVSVGAEAGTQEGGNLPGTERGTERAKEGPQGALFSRSG